LSFAEMISLLLILTPLVSGTPAGYFYQPRQYYRPRAYHNSYPYQPFTVWNNNVQISNNNLGSLVRTANSGDIIEQTKAQTQSLVATIKELNKNPVASKYIQRVLGASSCLDNLEDAISAIEQGSNLVENAGEDIIKLIATARGLVNKKDIPVLVRDAAEILRQLEVLIPKLAPATPEVCKAGSQESFDALRGVAALLNDVSKDNQIRLTYETREELIRSAKVIIGVTAFLEQLGESFRDFDKSCTADRDYNIRAIATIGDTLDNLADLFGVLGGFEDAEKIRDQANFTRRVAKAINNEKLKELDLGTLNCETAGNFQIAATTLEDIATIIEEVGIDELSAQLGIVLIF